MAGTTIDIENFIDPHALATDISDRWTTWNNGRQTKLEEWKELRNYIYATDTRTTSNSKLPWTNSTTTPKLTQIATTYMLTISQRYSPSNVGSSSKHTTKTQT